MPLPNVFPVRYYPSRLAISRWNLEQHTYLRTYALLRGCVLCHWSGRCPHRRSLDWDWDLYVGPRIKLSNLLRIGQGVCVQPVRGCPGEGGMPSHVDTTGNSRTPVWAERSDPSVDGFRPKNRAMSDPLCGRKWAVDCEVLSSMRTDLAGWMG